MRFFFDVLNLIYQIGSLLQLLNGTETYLVAVVMITRFSDYHDFFSRQQISFGQKRAEQWWLVRLRGIASFC